MATRAALFFDVFARDRTRATFAGIARSTDTLSTKVARFGKLAAGVAVAGAVAFAAQGVRSFIEFDDKMTQSLAIMGHISGPMRQRMETAAREVGKTTRFGASEAAEAYFFLASAGLDAEQSVAAMPQVAKFAQAGMVDLARATDLATDAQSALGLASKDPEQNLRNLTRVTDVLVGANTLANASVEQFASALTGKAGPAMRQANIQIEQGVAVLAHFADQGIKGDRASTLFAATLEQLQRNAINNRDAFERLGISVFDSEGNMRNMSDVVADLEGSFAGMSVEQQKAALMQLGFNRNALQGIEAMLGSSAAIRDYEQQLLSMGGITEEVADKQLESFAAKLDLIKSRSADAALAVGGVLVNATFEAGRTAGEMGRMFGELPGPIQTTTLAAAGIVTAAPLVIGSWRRIRAAIDAARASLAAMTVAGRTATLSMGAVGLALAAGAAVLAFFARRNLEAEQRVDDLTGSLERQTGAVTDNTREIAFNNLEKTDAIERAKRLGIGLDTLVDAYLGEEAAIAAVDAATADLVDQKERMVLESNTARERLTAEAIAARGLRDEILVGNEAMDEARQRQQDRAAAGLDAAGADEQMADAAAMATGVIEEQVDAVDDLIRSLDQMVKSVFAARDAERAYEQALDDARDAIAENGATLDITTEAGRRNERQLDRLAEAALKDAAATLEDAEANGTLAESQELVSQRMEQARKDFIAVAREMGLSKKEAKDLADQLGLIPGNYEAVVTADTSGARRSVADFTQWVSNQRPHMTVGASGEFKAFARGGFARRGTAAIVGEEGPELVSFGRNAQVHSNRDTVAMLRAALRGGDGAQQASGGDTHVHVTTLNEVYSHRQVMDNLALNGAT